MLVALSGVQGSGKTTVLNGLKNIGYNVVERKTARSILADWNLKLEEVYANQDTCKKFHDELLIRKATDELEALNSDQLWFTERSYADLFTYALISLGHFNKYSEWLDQYYDACKTEHAKYLAVCFLSAPRNRVVENDGVRGVNKHYVQQIDANVRMACESMCVHHTNIYEVHNPLIEVVYDFVEQRVRFVAAQAVSLWLTEQLNVDDNYQLTDKHPVRIEHQRVYAERAAMSKSAINI